MEQGQVDLGVIQETKLINRVYMRESIGFQVTTAAALSAHCGGIAVFYRKAENLANEELCIHGPNVISVHMVTGRRRWHIIGRYIFPSDASTIEYIIASTMAQNYRADFLVAGNINNNLEDPEGTPQAEAIADKLTAAGLMDMCLHFLPRCKP